jgi:hypothetical protein
MLQSRLTVAGDTLSTSAVSSTLESAKKTHLDDLYLAWIETSQRVQRIIEGDKISAWVRGSITAHDSDLFQRDMLHTRPALYVMATGMVHQYAPHHLGRNRKKMGSILPLHALVIHQSHVGLIDQGGRLESVARALALHIAVSEAAEFIINNRRQPLERAVVSIAPGAEQRAYVVCIQLTRHWRHGHPYTLNYTAPASPKNFRSRR